MHESDTVSLVVGLGNPGAEYAETRHNAGCAVAEGVARRLRNAAGKNAFHARWIEGRFGGRTLAVMMPRTYMNCSGEAVAAVLRSGRCEASEMLVVYDCLDLPFGRIRMRSRGGSGGHRGLQSILDAVGTHDVPRLRIGIGPVPATRDAADYVLSPWTPEERRRLPALAEHAGDAILAAARQGVRAAMNQFNGKTDIVNQGATGAEPPETEPEH